MPKWPLPDNVALAAAKQVADVGVRDLTKELADCDDGRSRRRIQRELKAATTESIRLAMVIAEQRRLELDLWAVLWKTPQAVEWEKLRYDREIAQYVRWKVRAETGDLAAGREARMLGDRLGLTPAGLIRLHWGIEQPGDPPPAKPRKRRQTPDPRRALYAVPDEPAKA